MTPALAFRQLVSDALHFAKEQPTSHWEPVFEKELLNFYPQAASQPVQAAPTVKQLAAPLPKPVLQPIKPTLQPQILENKPEAVSSLPPAPTITSEESSPFKLQPLEAKYAIDYNKIRHLIQEIAPRLELLEEPLSDAKAKLTVTPIAPETRLILIAENNREAAFLNNLQKAIESLGCSTSLLFAREWEQHQRWELLLKSPSQCFLLAMSSIQNYPLMKQHCRRDSATQLPTFQNKPVLFMGDPSTYLASPQLKAGLWEKIKAFLSAQGTDKEV